MPKKHNGGGRIDAETFVRAWKKGGTVSDVAGRLGSSVQTVQSRAVRLRTMGVKLPKLTRLPSGPRVDVAALNAILKA